MSILGKMRIILKDKLQEKKERRGKCCEIDMV